jgi:hypothetical protein
MAASSSTLSRHAHRKRHATQPSALPTGAKASGRAKWPALLLVLSIALGLRLWGVMHDLPFSYFGDELHFMKRSMAMGTGDLNPHWFHKPALLMYVLAGCYGTYFALGWVLGWFQSTAHFGAYFLANMGPFLLIGRLVVLACGVAIVLAVYQIAIKVYNSRASALAAAGCQVAGFSHLRGRQAGRRLERCRFDPTREGREAFRDSQFRYRGGNPQSLA